MAEKNAPKNVKADPKTEVAKNSTTEKTAEKKAPKVEIIRGRMPAPVVLAIKTEDEGQTDGALAAKYRTTNGKVSDIRKNRNFGYITKESYVPNQDDCDKTVAWAEEHGDKDMIKWAKSLKPGSEKDRAKYDESRKASRPGRKKADPAPEKEEVKTGTTVGDQNVPTDGDLAELTE